MHHTHISKNVLDRARYFRCPETGRQIEAMLKAFTWKATVTHGLEIKKKYAICHITENWATPGVL